MACLQIIRSATTSLFVTLRAYATHTETGRFEFNSTHTQLGLSLTQPTPLQVAEAFQRVLIDRAQVWKLDQDKTDFQPDVSGTPPERQAAEFERKTKRINALRDLHLNRYWSGCDYFRGSRHYEDQFAKSICGQLELNGPLDSTIPGQLRRYQLKSSLDYPYGSSWRVEEIWDIFDDCRNPQDVVSVLNRAKSFYTQEYRIWRTTRPCSFNTALARLNSAFNGDPGVTGEALAVLADAAHEEKDIATAFYLYRLSTLAAPSGPAFARSAFNQGYLLRSEGFPCQSIRILQTIFESQANDKDRGSHLMEAFRNYRHRAALEIAGAYADMGNYPMSCYWLWLADYRYEYQSWCGTCRWDEDAVMRKRLIDTSLAAGPLVFAANIVSAPITNWRVWLIFCVSCWVIRKLTRRMPCMATGTGDGTRAQER